MNCFEILQIERTTDKKVIRHAYAELAKIYHMETHPKEFEQIKEAYNEAMEYAKHGEIPEYEKRNDDSAKAENIASEYGGIAYDEYERIAYEEYFARLREKATPEGIFFETNVEEIYEQERMKEIRNLEGIQKIRKDLEEQRGGGYSYFRKYVMSSEFIKYQYDKCYIKMVAELFADAAKKLEYSRLVDMFLPFGMMYGLFSEENKAYSYDEIMELSRIPFYEQADDFMDSEAMEPIVTFAKQNIDLNMVQSRLKKDEIQLFLLVARQFRIISLGYGTGNYTPTIANWHSALKHMDYDIIPVLKIKNDFSMWQMVEQLIRNHPEIELKVFLAVDEWFYLADSMRSSKKKIYGPVVQAIEESTGINMQVLAGNENYINTPQDYANLLKIFEAYLKDGKEEVTDFDVLAGVLSKIKGIEKFRKACRKDAFLVARKDMIVAEHLRKILNQYEKDYELWKVFFEAYSFTILSTEPEKMIMDNLNQYTSYIEQYWQEAEMMFSERKETIG